MTDDASGVPAWIADIPKTIELTRPDIIALCQGDPGRFALWVATDARREYRGLSEAPPALPLDHLAARAASALPGVEPALSQMMEQIYSLRPDLQANFDLSDPVGQQRLVWWFLIEGAQESALQAEFALSAGRPLLDQPASEALPGVAPTLTRFMALAHRMRSDLQAAFDLRTADGQQNFVWWFFVHGLTELGAGRFVTEQQRRFLNAPDEGNGPLTRLMMQLWQRRPPLAAAYRLDSEEGRAAFVCWYYSRGLDELRLTDLLDEQQCRDLLAPAGNGVTVILAMLWHTDPELRGRFSDPAQMQASGWHNSPEARERFPILRRLFPEAALSAPSVLRGREASPFGVNLIGYARGQFGIGEDVRMAARAMQAAGIPFSLYNIEPGREVCQDDHSADGLISDRRPYSIDMFCTTGIETARLAAVEGKALFDGRRRIGYWPWELAEWPKEWAHAYTLVDEVWASSRHTYEAYIRSCPKPVRHLPMTVTVEESAGLGRRDFQLPEHRFLFVFSFDVLSSLSRKNPEACIAAFRKAFPRGDEPVGLVVKVMRAVAENPHWQALQRLAAEDGRIHIISLTLARAELLDLYRACDCFVSLHRAEGFGRGIAEAMMLDKPVIVTGYSGNMDFTTPGTAALVGYRMRSLTPGEYPFGDGQVWADPDIDHAGWWMRRLVAEPAHRNRLAGSGQNLAFASFSPTVVGESYAAVLKDHF